ncbi:MAG TPA: putative Ig domain-containing protein, partial [Steroidobacteraceae bacterium]|nr:putative Ig domain-containing protein [Steroidobacteraceae bacterium]
MEHFSAPLAQVKLWLLLGMTALVLAACGGGGGADPTATPQSADLSISGQPPSSVTAGSAYSFTPTVTAPSGVTLTFSITAMPSWAAFNTGTGTLSGTPANSDAGSYTGISISVSDGSQAQQLGAFSITVNAQSGGGSAPPTISGTPPTSVT